MIKEVEEFEELLNLYKRFSELTNDELARLCHLETEYAKKLLVLGQEDSKPYVNQSYANEYEKLTKKIQNIKKRIEVRINKCCEDLCYLDEDSHMATVYRTEAQTLKSIYDLLENVEGEINL